MENENTLNGPARQQRRKRASPEAADAKRSRQSSKKKKGIVRATIPPLQAELPEFRVGAIKRVELRNFMTYDYVGLSPGPALNMILGPNGSGKSSLACAICLGLAGKTKSVTRGDKFNDFIKRGQKKAVIDLTLHKAGKGGKDVVIRRVINDNNSSQFFMGPSSRRLSASSQKEVKDLTGRLKIQVDNLCVFLAQDNISSFASMTPSELLEKMQEGVDPELLKQYQKLVQLGKDLKKEQEIAQKEDQQLEQEVQLMQGLEEVVNRMNARKQTEQELDLMKKNKLWVEFDLHRREALKLKEAFSEAKRNLIEAESKIEPLNDKQRALSLTVNEADRGKKSMLSRHNTRVRSIEDRLKNVQDYDRKIEKVMTDMEEQHEEAANQEKLVRKLQARLAKTENDLAQAESTDYSAELFSINQERKELAEKMNSLRQELRVAEDARRDAVREAKTIQAKLGRQSDASRRKLDALRRRNNRFEKVEQFLARNKHKLKGEVIGPVAQHVTLKDKNCGQYLEQVLGVSNMTAYLCTHKDDFHLLLDRSSRLSGTVKFSLIRGSNNYNHLFDIKKLHPNLAWLDEVVEARPEVMAYLTQDCNIQNSAINRSAKPLTIEEREVVLAQTVREKRSKLLLLLDGDTSFRVGFSKYGANDRSLESSAIRPASVFTRADNDETEELKTALAEAQSKVNDRNAEVAQIQEELRPMKEESDALNEKLRGLNRQKNSVTKLKQLVKKQKDSLAKAERMDFEAVIKKLDAQRTKLIKKKAHVVVQFTGEVKALRQMELKLDRYTLEAMLAKSLHQQALNEYEEAQAQLKGLQDIAVTASGLYKEKMKVVKMLSKRAEEQAPLKQYQKLFRDLTQDLDEVNAKISELTARLETMPNQDQKKVDEYNHHKAKVEALQERKDNRDRDRAEKEEAIAALKESYLPRIRDVVEKVNESFKAFYEMNDCQGEVRLKSSEDDFEKWELQIRVSYRKGAGLAQLSRNVQSGGERAVATMLFLLCLQKVTDTPFRVIDEINQGMDANNERMILSRIVENCNGANQPQYFMITPKLLPNLQYSDRVSTLIVHNGAWNNVDSWEGED